ncbi:serine protease [Methylosinus sp. C49]|uniref:S1C family serine protease n=1 Tax=Methylosinus sp. C49 TaxID=2699395 RepID=UPI001379F0C7|nr:serine protease [Methylosinus sp. C49]
MRKNSALAIVCACLLQISDLSPSHAAGLRLEGTERWVVLGAKQDKTEAIDLARNFAQSVSGVRVVRGAKDWFAVIVGPLAVPSIEKARAALGPRLWLPQDAYLSRGERYVETVFEAPPSPILAVLEYKGEKPTRMTFGNLSVVLSSLHDKQGNREPTIRGELDGKPAFFARINENAAAEGQTLSSRARIIKLDPSSPTPQVVFSYFWGGAHCCTVTKIATTDPGTGKWRIIDAQTLDGDGYSFEDIDGDGAVELLSNDNSFLYAFDSYAASATPPKVFRLSGGTLRDVTLDATSRPYLRRALKRMEGWATQSPEMWGSNGFLAGWVAAKAQLGEFDEAWRQMQKSHDRNSEWPLKECLLPVSIDRCPDGKKRNVSFPDALRAHLLKNSYFSSPPAPSAETHSSESPPIASRPEQKKPVDSGSVTGTGFFISKNGHILTNAHVVENCASIRLVYGSDGPRALRLLSRDTTNDLAILKPDDFGVTPAAFRFRVRLGEEIAVFGFPLSGLLTTHGNFTLGNITGLAGIHDDTRMLQISAPVQPGNSGGPLLDQTGAIAGVVVSKLDVLKVAAATDDFAQNVNFAIKANVVRTFAEAQGITLIEAKIDDAKLSPADLADRAKSFTGQVECKR